MKPFLYIIIILLIFIIFYSLFFNNYTKEGLGATSTVGSSGPSADQCLAYVYNNPTIDATNYSDFMSCNAESIGNLINSIGNAQTLLKQLEPSSEPYLMNTFSQDISAALSLTQQSSLIGKSWNTVSENLSPTSSIVSTLNQDVMYLQYLTGTPPSYPSFADGGDVPTYIQQVIQSNSCTPLIDPSFNQTQLNTLNQTLQKQQNLLASIENDISNIRKRYPIQFSIGTVSVDSTPGASPSIQVSGQVPSPVLNFTILSALDGPVGIAGEQGAQGLPGTPGDHGPKGLDGYWGSMGILDNVYGSV